MINSQKIVHKAARNNPSTLQNCMHPVSTNKSVSFCKEYQQLFEKKNFDDQTIEIGESVRHFTQAANLVKA